MRLYYLYSMEEEAEALRVKLTAKVVEPFLETWQIDNLKILPLKSL